LGSVLTMLLLAVMWGLSIPATKLGLQTLPPLTLTALRFAVAVPLLLPFVAGQLLPWRDLLSLAALGLLGVSFGQVAQAFGVAGTSASVGTILSATIPVFIVIFAALRLKQSVSAWQKVGLLAAFAGIVLVALDGQATSAVQASVRGVTWMLLSAIAIAAYYVWSFQLAHKYGAGALAAWSTFFGFLAILPLAGWEMWHVPFQFTSEGIAAAVYLGAVVTVAGLFMWLSLLRTVPANTAASVQYLQPIIGIAASAMMFGDKLGVLFAAGTALVLCGLAITMKVRRPKV
jgi:O-acetylserine/cysteine efflux transporter